MKAYAWRTGRIDFGRKVPDGAIQIAEAPAKFLRQEISAVARHAYDGKTLLVPGVPEAKNGNSAVDALIAFADWIKPRFVKPGGC